MGLVLLILIGGLLIEIIYSPRLDFTREENLLLWYGDKTRKYIKLW